MTDNFSGWGGMTLSGYVHRLVSITQQLDEAARPKPRPKSPVLS
jgi:hypothetical protein